MQKPILIGIAGASGSGKTTFGWKLKKSSSDFEHLRLDNYLKHPRTFSTKHGFKNWESPNNIKFDLLLKHLKMLSQGKEVKIKIPAAVTGGRASEATVKPKQFIVVEGFILFIYKKIRDIFDFRIFFDLPVELIPERRKKRSGKNYQEYDLKVAVPEYLRVGIKQKQYADLIVDATLPANVIFKILKSFILKNKKQLSKGKLFETLKN